MTGWAWLNDQVVPEHEARVSIWDRGLLYGDGVFETLRAYHGRPFQVRAHLTRLQHGLARLGIHGAPALAEFERAIHTLLERETAPEILLRLLVTRGVAVGGWRGAPPEAPTVIIVARASPLPPEEWYEEGARVVWCDVPMMQAPWWPSDVKHCNWLPRILAKGHVDATGADEGLLRTMRGMLAEGLTSNVFVVQGGVIRTPGLEEGALPGVTRGVVMRLARKRGRAVAEASLPAETVAGADEIFYTNAGLGLVPVTLLEDRPVGTGRPGPAWRELAAAYWTETGR